MPPTHTPILNRERLDLQKAHLVPTVRGRGGKDREVTMAFEVTEKLSEKAQGALS